jgi:glutamine phosphoribosylpyrophosphate amidotransferase
LQLAASSKSSACAAAADHRACLYGTDTPERRELLASSQNTEQSQAFVGADSLRYLPEEGMLSCLATPPSTSAPRASPAAIGFWTVTAPPR